MTSQIPSGGNAPAVRAHSGSAATDAANLRAILLLSLSMSMFAIDDMFIKLASADIGVGQILTFQSLAAIVYFVWVARARGDSFTRQALVTRSLVLRQVGEVSGALCFVTSYSLMPISNASAILQVSPLFVTLGAGLFLRESVGWRRWMAIAAGFAGVLLVVRPGMEGFNAASLLAIAGAVGFAVRDIGTRAAPRSVPTSIIALVANILMLFASIALQFWLGPWKPMSGHVVLLVAAASVFGVAGMHSVTMALRLGEVSVVAPFRYVRVVAAMVIGILVFAERPDIFAAAGSLLIVASGIYTLYREQKSRQERRHGS